MIFHEHTRGFTLIELVVSAGIFALVMVLASGAYLMMLSLNRETQTLITGTNDLSFAIDSMTRTIRTGRQYNCTDCNDEDTSDAITVISERNETVTYSLVNGAIQQVINGGAASALTQPSVAIDSLKFYAVGTTPGDGQQARVTIVISGTVAPDAAKQSKRFTIQTGATMRGTDL